MIALTMTLVLPLTTRMLRYIPPNFLTIAHLLSAVMFLLYQLCAKVTYGTKLQEKMA